LDLGFVKAQLINLDIPDVPVFERLWCRAGKGRAEANQECNTSSPIHISKKPIRAQNPSPPVEINHTFALSSLVER